MPFFDLADMTVAYVQYIYMLVSISPESFPPFFVEPFVSLKFLALDILNHLSEEQRYNNPLTITLPFWIPLDSRLTFVLVAVIVPLLVSLFGFLVSSKSIDFVWIVLTNISLFSMLFGILSLTIPQIYPKKLLPQRTRLLLTVIGTTMFALLVSLGVVGFCMRRNRRKKKEKEIIMASLDNREEIQSVSLAEKAVSRTVINYRALAALHAFEQEKEQYIAKRHLTGSISLAFVTCACLVGALISLGVPSFKTIAFYQVSVVGRGIGFFLLVCAVLTSAWFVIGLFERGRKIQTAFYSFVAEPLLMTTLILISFIYSPVLLHIIYIIWCTLVVCGSGESLTVAGSLAHSIERNSIWGPPENVCTACIFNTTQQNCPLSLQNLLCFSPTKQSRLAYDRNVPCKDIDVFYKTAVGIMVVSYSVVYPIFLALIAKQATKILEEEFPLEKRISDEFSEKELYYEKVQKSKNISAGIYEVFKRRFRMARLTLLMQRVLFTIITALTRRGLEDKPLWIGISLIFAVVSLYLAYISILRPFARPVENLYNASQQLTLVLVGCLGLVGSIRGRDAIPFGVSVTVAVFIFVVPISALVAGFVFTFRIVRRRAERLQRRLQRGIVIVEKEENQGEDTSSLRGCSTQACTPNGGRSVSHEDGKKDSQNIPVSAKSSGNERKNASPDSKDITGEHAPLEETHAFNNFASEPYIETEPLGAIAGNKRKKLHASFASKASTGAKEAPGEDIPSEKRDFVLGDPDNESADLDDYFGDKRVFVPAEYFKGYNKVPIVLQAGAEDPHEPHAENNISAPASFLQTARHSIMAFLRLDKTHSAASPQEDAPTAACPTSNNSVALRSLNNDNNEESNVNVRPQAKKKKVGTSCLRCWHKIFDLNGDRLCYKDVLERRKELEMTTGIAERPFWIAPTVAQRQNLRTAGGLTPSFCARNASMMDKNTFSGTILAQIREHKSLKRELHFAQETEVQSENKGDTAVPSYLDQTALGCTYDGDNCILWDCVKDASFTSDSLDGFYNSSTITIDKNNLRSLLIDRAHRRTSIPSIPDPARNSIISGSDTHQVSSARENTANIRLPETINLPTQLMVLLNSQCRLDELKKRCPRSIGNQSLLDGSRPSLYAKSISNVQIDNKDIKDWESFVYRLLDDIDVPFKNKNDALAKQAVKQQGSDILDEEQPLPQPQQQQESEENDKKEKHTQEGQSLNASDPLYEEQVSHLCRHTVLRRRLLAAFKQQREKLADLQRAVDYRIAQTVKKYIQAFFMGISFFAVCALVMCICGMLNSRDASFVDGVHKDNSVSYQLMGYESWDEFTLNCCCSPYTDIKAKFPYYALDTELWTCADGRSKERVRRDAYTSKIVSGYAVRGLCEMEFVNGCRLEVNEDGVVRLTSCVGVPPIEQERW